MSQRPQMIMNETSKVFQYRQYKAARWESVETGVILEQEVSLTVNGELWLSFMCTPVDLEALAVGFLFNENLLNSIDDIISVRACPTMTNVDVWLNKSIQRPEIWRRTSGCGGGITHETKNPTDLTRDPVDDVVFSASTVTRLFEQFLGSQDLYRRVGGVHSSAVCDGQKIIVMTDDIGRHNTLDKIAGRCLLDRIKLEHSILITTGRVSSEMLQKAGRIGASMVVSRSSPSSLAIEIAQREGITLIGYARGSQFNVYTFPNRLNL
jgi:FdhD protein